MFKRLLNLDTELMVLGTRLYVAKEDFLSNLRYLKRTSYRNQTKEKNQKLQGSMKESLVMTAVNICRRKFRSDEVKMLIPLDEKQEAETGVVFTDNAVFYWKENNQFVFEIPFAQIKGVDFDKSIIAITSVTDETFEIDCVNHPDKTIERSLYGYIMDIVEELSVDEKEGRPRFVFDHVLVKDTCK